MRWILLLALVAWVVWWGTLLYRRPRYRRDERNPFRIWCKSCEQEFHQHRNAFGRDTWEAMYNIVDPACRCHKA